MKRLQLHDSSTEIREEMSIRIGARLLNHACLLRATLLSCVLDAARIPIDPAESLGAGPAGCSHDILDPLDGSLLPSTAPDRRCPSFNSLDGAAMRQSAVVHVNTGDSAS